MSKHKLAPALDPCPPSPLQEENENENNRKKQILQIQHNMQG